MRLLAAIYVVCLAIPISAESVVLKDGSRLEGDLKRTPGGYMLTDSTGKTTSIPDSDVQSIQLRSTTAPASADSALTALRRAAANMSDPARAIGEYQKFIQQHPGTPQATQAANELGAWQERLERRLVKVGNQWVDQQGLAKRKAQADEAARQAQQLVASGNIVGATAQIAEALSSDPDSAALLYLRGLVLFRRNQLIGARDALQRAAALLPNSAPIHNNLAVVLYQTHAQIAALLEYEKAMQASPQNQRVLDNVAEALHALPDSYAKNPVTRRVRDLFNRQDEVLQKQMATKGLHRFGAQWLSEDDFSDFQNAQKNAQEQLQSKDAESLSIQTRLMQIDHDIEKDKREMEDIRREWSYIDDSGRIATSSLPSRYYDLNAEVKTLATEKIMKTRQLEAIPKRLAEAQQAASGRQPYTGKQEMFDQRFAPVEVPSTQPTTAATTQPGK